MSRHVLALTVCLFLPLPLFAQEADPAAFADPMFPEPLPGMATEAPDCARLAAEAGAVEGIPDGLLPAISLVETGKSDGAGGRMPWAWTLNQGGQSYYLNSADEALAQLDQILATGTTNVDVGCMQLNWKWHSEAFASRADMMDPVQNTAYAARFLKELYNQLGSWELATAAYHSTDPNRGQAYLAKVSAAQEVMLALLPTLPQQGGTTPPVLLAAVPMRLQGLLALSGSPLFEQATERAALISRGEAPPADPEAPPPAFAPGEDDPDLPLVEPQVAAAQPRRDPPDLPMVMAATESQTADRASAPQRLQADWDTVEEMRRILAQDP